MRTMRNVPSKNKCVWAHKTENIYKLSSDLY